MHVFHISFCFVTDGPPAHHLQCTEMNIPSVLLHSGLWNLVCVSNSISYGSTSQKNLCPPVLILHGNLINLNWNIYMQWKRGMKDFVNKFRWRYTTCLWVFFLPYVFYESKLRLIIRIVSLVRHPARRNQSGNASLGKVPLSFLLHCPKTGQSICKSLIKEACWCCMYKLCFCFNSSPPPSLVSLQSWH